MRAGVFVAFAGALAVSLALLGALVAQWLGVEVNIWTSVATALVIGVFVALILLGPRNGEREEDAPRVEGGFDVVDAKEREEVQQRSGKE